MAHRERVAIVATMAVLGLAACAPKVALPTAGATTSPSAQPTEAPPTATPTPTTPTGFEPRAMSAISENDFWVLGDDACASSVCLSEILHTENGGRSFQRIPAPPGVYLAGNTTTPGPPQARDLRFADADDGWVFGDTLWATHDGGNTWRQITFGGTLLSVSQLEPGANGYVYAVFEVCTDPSTGSGCLYRLERSRAGSDTWTVIVPPGNPAGRQQIGVRGDTLWVMYFDRSTGLEWISRDDGNLWVRGSMPCEPDLGGSFDPVSNSVIWAFCATGTMGGPSVSTNAGGTYGSARTATTPFSNAGIVAALSSRHAFVVTPSIGIEVTSDGGATFHNVASLAGAQWAGFTDSEVGYVVTLLNPSTQVSRLWRTVDAGVNWAPVSFS